MIKLLFLGSMYFILGTCFELLAFTGLKQSGNDAAYFMIKNYNLYKIIFCKSIKKYS